MSGNGLSLALWQHAAALGLAVLDIVVRGARSSTLLPVRLRNGIIANCCGDAVAAVTPARLGGDPARFVWFTRSGQLPAAVLASFATEHVLNTVVLTAGAIVTSVWFAPAMWGLSRRLFGGAALARTVGILVVACLLGAIAVIALRRWAPGLAVRVVGLARDTWRQFRSQTPRTVLWAGLWTLVSMLARTAILPVLLARIPGIPTTALILGSVQAIYLLQLAPTPGGVGLVEGGFVAAFGHTIGVGEVAKLVIVWRAYTWLCSAAVGAVLLVRDRRASRRSVTS